MDRIEESRVINSALKIERLLDLLKIAHNGTEILGDCPICGNPSERKKNQGYHASITDRNRIICSKTGEPKDVTGLLNHLKIKYKASDLAAIALYYLDNDAEELGQYKKGTEGLSFIEVKYYNVERNQKTLAHNMQQLIITTPDTQYYESRGVSQETIDYFGIKTVDHYNQNKIAIPYILNKKPVGIELRAGENYSQKRSVTGTTKIPLNLDILADLPASTIYVTEGVFCALNLHSLGYTNVISFNGAGNIKGTCEYLKKFEHKYIIITDNDTAGEDSIQTINEIGLKASIVQTPTDKDFNDFYMRDKEAAILWIAEQDVDIIKKLRKTSAGGF